MADIPFTVFSWISMFFCIPPAYFNWKIPNRPWATLILIGWIFLLNLMYSIDSIIWRSTNLNEWWEGEIYCDITARLKDMFCIGVPGAAIGICRFLADATNPDPSQRDLKHGRFRRNMIDLFLGVLLPVTVVGLKFICEVNRYRIRGVVGCGGTYDYSWPSIFLWIIWAPLLCIIASIYSCVFLRHWWIRRKRLHETWALGMHNGISRGEFTRLLIAVLSVLFVYLPLAIIALVQMARMKLLPYRWSVAHGPFWDIIIKISVPRAPWANWVGIALAATQFLLCGFTRNSKQFYGRCFVFVFDHSPRFLRKRLPAIEKYSASLKERQEAESITKRGQRNPVPMNEKPYRKAAQNWFDSDEDLEDGKSLHSSESTVNYARDEEEGDAMAAVIRGSQTNPSGIKGTTTTEVSAGPDELSAGWTYGVKVTRQVIVETSVR